MKCFLEMLRCVPFPRQCSHDNSTHHTGFGDHDFVSVVMVTQGQKGKAASYKGVDIHLVHYLQIVYFQET